MKRWIMRGLLAAFLIMTARYAFINSWASVRFIFANFFEIVSGQVECPSIDISVVTAFVCSAAFAGMLVNTIPHKNPDGAADDENDD